MEIQADKNKPYVKLNKEKCVITFKGKSYPEHPKVFYEPILEELNKCSEHIEGETITINLALEIMNSISTKYIYNIIKSIDESSKKLNINWYCEEDDDDMKEEGYVFNNAFPNTNFKIISVSNLYNINI